VSAIYLNAVDVEGLSKRYGNNWAIRNVTFNVARGELVTLLGRNGAGKSTTVKVLTTLLRPSGGKARVMDYDLWSEWRRIRRLVSYLPQDYHGFMMDELTPLEAVGWSLVARGDYGLSEAKAVAKDWLNRLGLESICDVKCNRLSGGQRRRVAVAMTLAARADVVFLDEPTSGVDVEAKHNVWRILREALRSGLSVVLTTHDMNEAQMVSDRVAVFSNGETIVEDSPSELIRRLPYRYKVAFTKPDGLRIDVDGFQEQVDLGDRLIGYTKSSQEAWSIASRIHSSVNVESISEVGLEDAYLYLTNTLEGGQKSV
jgi:ABC-2 type transport system ATP-binding protein